MPARVLVVDDEPLARDFAVEALRRAGYEVSAAADGEEAMHAVAAEGPHVVVCDLMMPRVGGLQFLEWSREHAPDVQVVMTTAHGEIHTAVHAMRLGAFDYIPKPFSREQLAYLVSQAAERMRRLRETDELRQALRGKPGDEAIVGQDPAIEKLRERIALAAQSDITVLITGETGTGKELVARALHAASRRCAAPFVAVNCAALPETLIASELFGHERGSFTTAVKTRIGRFEAADGGTLLLDEIGDLPPPVQGTLLRVLQEKSFERVGSSRSQAVDVRVVAASKQDLAEAVREGRFREDLYFRIQVMSIVCPPLRARRGDISLLTAHFLERLEPRMQGAPRLSLTRAGMSKLVGYHWPGNVRELENVLTSAAVLASGGQIDARHLELSMEPSAEGAASEPLRLEAIERAHMRRVLDMHGWNRSEAARTLGIDRGTLQRKIARHGLSPSA